MQVMQALSTVTSGSKNKTLKAFKHLTLQPLSSHQSLQNQLLWPSLQLLQPLDLDLHDPQHRIAMLTAYMFLLPLPPLGLDLLHHGPTVHAHHTRPTLKEPVVQVIRLAGPPAVVVFRRVGAGLEGVVARAEQGGAVQPQDVPRLDAVHVEGQAQRVAFREEVGEAVDVGGDVVGSLRGQVEEQLLEGFGEDERFARARAVEGGGGGGW